MSAPTRQCPKCGRIVPAADECAGCGVDFSKVHITEVPSAVSMNRPDGPDSRGSRVLRSVVGLIVVLAVGAWAAVGWVGGRDPVEPAERLVHALPGERARPVLPDSNPVGAARQRLAALPPLEGPARRAEPAKAVPAPAPAPAPASQVAKQ